MFLFVIFGAVAATSRTPKTSPSKYVDPESYAYMYPYLSNQMRTELNPGVTVSQQNNPTSVFVKTRQMGAQRNVVPRTRKNSAGATTAKTNTQPARRVVQRSKSKVARSATAVASPTTRTRSVVPRNTMRARSDRANNSVAARNDAIEPTNDSTSISSTRCMADYVNCMNGYCERQDTAYNRCFCSAKLAQIDAKYRPAIDQLVQQIIRLQSGVDFDEQEFYEYWMDMVGNYVGENSWLNIDNALNIDWSTSENRTRGQQAFVTGHQYCSQHLRGCAYMAGNMRDSYRSQISRDCKTYENTLEKIKTTAESAVQQYSE